MRLKIVFFHLWKMLSTHLKQQMRKSLRTTQRRRGVVWSNLAKATFLLSHELDNERTCNLICECNYCECFAAGVYCVEPCACIDCFNKPVHEETVLSTRKQIESRNPLDFAPKVVRSSDSLIEIGDDSINTPASARHKRGCNCKKSYCLKKYCECYQFLRASLNGSSWAN